MIWIGLLLVLALVLNWGDRKMLVLTAAVGAGYFSPVPDHDKVAFYLACIFAEGFVFSVAWYLDIPASGPIMLTSGLMILSHILGWNLGGYPPFSPYRVLVPILEPLQVIACSVWSCTVLRKVGKL